jgi:two-component sensor histidine kinase
MACDRLPWIIPRHQRGEVVYIADVSNLPPAAWREKQEFERQRIQSLICVPLTCRGRVLGFVGFDAVRQPKPWRTDHIRVLKVVGEIIAGAIERERAIARLSHQAQMEKLLARISTRFINVPMRDLDIEIEHALGSIGGFLGAHRCYVFQLNDDGASLDNTHLWCAQGLGPQIPRLRRIAVSEFGYALRCMGAGEAFQVPKVADLPSEGARERRLFELGGIQSLIDVPIVARGIITGFLGCDSVTKLRFWSKDDIQLLEMLAGILANAIDRQKVDRKLQVSLREKEVLLREIHHRVKNNMQIVYSLLYLQANAFRDRADSAALEAFKQSRNRIKAMAMIHEQLYRSRDLEWIDIGDYLKALIPELTDSYGAGRHVSVKLHAGRAHVNIDTAIPCGLVVNELISNALEHAFPAGEPGRISVAVRTAKDGDLELKIADNGVGIPTDEASRNSNTFGLQLVRDLVRQLGGTLELERGRGTCFKIRLTPADQRARRQPKGMG